MTEQQEWESAYLSFETPEEEVRKFRGRLLRAGAGRWERNLKILDLFCGRGGGLLAWEELGFTNLIGLDLSRPLLDGYRGPSILLQGDARAIPMASASRDVVCVQGGLHHLESLDDMGIVLYEIHRVLKPDGKLIVVEPWLTPFLVVVHAICRQRWTWPLSARLESLARMIQLEEPRYSRWLTHPMQIIRLLQERFAPLSERQRWGKLTFVGVRR